MLSVLLLCDDRPSHAPNVLEHIRALRGFSRHRVDTFNPYGVGRSRLLRLGSYDAVVVHYTLFVLSDRYLSPWFREQLAAFGGLKVQFIQDEYRQVDAVSARVRELGIDVLFSSVPTEAVPQVYGSRLPGVDVLPTLTGYVPAELEGHPRPPLEDRPLDVVYRGRSIPYWLGRLGQEKVAIGREFLARAAATDLRCDISWSEADRIYGDAWYGFLGSSRTTLGTESGASIVDFDGSLQERTDEYLADRPSATFEEVEREILEPFEGNAVIQAISPRVFEAAALGTAMVNFAGRYSGVIEPWIHYVPLEKDFSNFDEVASAVRDDALIERLAARAHSDLVASGRYSLRTFVHEFDRELEARTRPGERRPRNPALTTLNRRLLELERLRSPRQRAELPLLVSLRNRAAERAGRSLIGRFPEIAALAHLEPEASDPDRVRHDLERLAAAAAAHVRELRYLGPPFDVRLELGGDDRRLTLVGTPGVAQDALERREIGDRVASAIRAGRLEDIVWTNSGVEPALTFASVPAASLEIGYDLRRGTHRFRALVELSRRHPDEVIAALEPLFLGRPDGPVHELDPRAARVLRFLWVNPGQSAAQGTAALRAVLGSKELRRLLRAYLGNPESRAEAPIEALLKDLLTLKLVGESPATLELDPDRKILVYRTNGDRPQGRGVLDPETVRALEQIVWDHDGVYRFDALTLVARRFPELATPALTRAVRAL